jgi:hypothetical protein
MASEYFGLNRGSQYELQPEEWTIGTSTGSTDMEFRMDLTKSLNTMDLVRFFEGLRVLALKGGFDTYFTQS